MADTTAHLNGSIKALPDGHRGIYKSQSGNYAISLCFREVEDWRREEKSTLWVDNPEALLVIAAEFARVADLCRGRYEEEQDRMKAAVEAVADSLRGHLSDAVAGDETVPHVSTEAAGGLRYDWVKLLNPVRHEAQAPGGYTLCAWTHDADEWFWDVRAPAGYTPRADCSESLADAQFAAEAALDEIVADTSATGHLVAAEAGGA